MPGRALGRSLKRTHPLSQAHSPAPHVYSPAPVDLLTLSLGLSAPRLTSDADTVVFCWSFVDRMVERGPGLRMGLAPFDVGPSMALDAPFQAIVYVGITSTLVSFIAMYLLRDEVVAVALETRRQHQLQNMQNSAMV